MAKTLYRSKTDRKIAGICGGLGKYFNIDPTIVRVIFILMLLPGGLARRVAVPRAVGCDSRRAVVLLTFCSVCA